MNLLRFLFQKCRGMVLVTALTALFSGVCNAGLIALINGIVNDPDHITRVLLLGFCALVLGKIVTGFVSQVWLIRFSQQAVSDLRRDLVRKILAVPLRQLEEIGAARLMAALTDDITSLTSALFGFPTLSVNFAILLGGSIYLAWLSWHLLLVMGLFILFGACCYRLFITSGFRSLVSAREAEDKLFGHFRALTEGIKELKLHRERRGAFLHHGLQSTTAEFQRHSVTAETRFILAHNWAHLLFYCLIGLILFLLPLYQQVSIKTMTGYVLTTLYLMGPLAGVMSSLSVFSRADIALRKVESLGMSLSARACEAAPGAAHPAVAAFGRLDLVGVAHAYHHEQGEDNFVLGPLNLTLHAGELVFLVGGNGSGKSTLAKIVTGLYPPESGEIRLDGRPVTDANRDDYRQLFSAVFADFYLFESLLGLKTPDLDAQAEDYLSQLHLRHKVKVANGRLSTTALSQGQRKRLALLTAYLEDRPFYVFDEWAADQDPVFKDIFYRQLLPDLRNRGKTVLVITHDDRYFHLADRVLKLDYGQLVAAPKHEPRFAQPVLATAPGR
ncbi:cyclic peptide export ABC transporter [Opitutus sp. GAS368]|uniref:cyclic peptide export ABC transporter n=1 Tax=Opitutus sp. GAS368 TaxID=1882749 RepID=UPI00087CD8DD|nr:cyclic peptide export ABC transporter [Opitutus sp. GAS368]SDS42329.1 putative ATP-binding cassette transporter [Opitutus sp. GAS368]